MRLLSAAAPPRAGTAPPLGAAAVDIMGCAGYAGDARACARRKALEALVGAARPRAPLRAAERALLYHWNGAAAALAAALAPRPLEYDVAVRVRSAGVGADAAVAIAWLETEAAERALECVAERVAAADAACDRAPRAAGERRGARVLVSADSDVARAAVARALEAALAARGRAAAVEHLFFVPPSAGGEKGAREWWASAGAALDWVLLARSAVVLDVGGGAAAAGDTPRRRRTAARSSTAWRARSPRPGDPCVPVAPRRRVVICRRAG